MKFTLLLALSQARVLKQNLAQSQWDDQDYYYYDADP